MLAYGIGLDIGISSVGWATVALDQDDHPYGIIGMGSRIFTSAENPKTGASLAAPRREARGARRRLRRHRHRNERIRNLLVQSNTISQDQLTHLFDGNLQDIYALRVKALDNLVSNTEFARILIHIAQRRGFRSNRKSAASKEDGQLLQAVNANRALMESKGYRTVAELLLKDNSFSECKRNHGGRYLSTVGREMIEDEVHKIFSAQRNMQNQIATESLEAEYTEILLSQRSFDEGPGSNSPYAGDQINRMIGKCQFETDEQRSAKACYSFEYFTLLSAINHIRLNEDGHSSPLSNEQRKTIIELAHQKADMNYSVIRTALGIPDSCTFNTVTYQKDKTQEESEKKAKFNYLKAYHTMRKAFDKLSKNYFLTFSLNQRNQLGEILSKYKTSGKIRPTLKNAGFSDEEIDIAEEMSFSKYGHLSVKACEKIIPYLENGDNYNDACEKAGYDFRSHAGNEKSRLLPPLDSDAKNVLTSPVVLRALSQSIKVVNAIIRERVCSPTFINVELAREMAKDFSERNAIKKENDLNHAENDRRMERIKNEFQRNNPSGLDLVKLRLFEEQQEISPYSQKKIERSRLFETGYVEVDHIIPYSDSFDDSYSNKVLVFTSENRDKGNRTPLQYLEKEQAEKFRVWVNSSVTNPRKRENLLKEKVTQEDREKFKERNLTDTKTASKFLMNYIRDNLEFAPFNVSRQKHVNAVNGRITSFIRKRWGITKVRANGDLHHAVDALVISCITDKLIQDVTRYYKYHEIRYQTEEQGQFIVDTTSGEILKEFPYPWEYFHQELDARLSSNPSNAVRGLNCPLYLSGEVIPKPLFVSRMPHHKVTGPAHKETIKSGKKIDQNTLIVKKPLTELKLKNGEIEGYYNPSSDRLLYETLKSQLILFGGNAQKAFAEKFYKPKKDGTRGPLVTKVKICESSTTSVPVLNGKGYADNDSMVRIDVYHVDNEGYYFIPIYVADTLAPHLPQKASVAHKSIKDWKVMSDDNFIFSLYPDDLVKITSKTQIKLSKASEKSDLPQSYSVESELLYFTSADIASASISLETHDSAYKCRGIGVKTLKQLKKYTVDVLGNVSSVSRERRQSFRKK